MDNQRLPNITEEMWDDAFQALLALNGYLSVNRDRAGDAIISRFVYPMECMFMAEQAIKAIRDAGYKPREEKP